MQRVGGAGENTTLQSIGTLSARSVGLKALRLAARCMQVQTAILDLSNNDIIRTRPICEGGSRGELSDVDMSSGRLAIQKEKSEARWEDSPVQVCIQRLAALAGCLK